MFSGEEIVRFRSAVPFAKLQELVEESLEGLGYVTFYEGGQFDVSAERHRSFATDVTLRGEVRKGRRPDEWIARVYYTVQPSALCWVIGIVGLLFCLIGPLIFLVPFLAKGEVQQAVERALRNLRYESEPVDVEE